MNRLGLRRRLLLVVVAAVAAALAGLVAVFNVLLGHNLSNDGTNLVRARAAAELAQIRSVKGRLVLSEAPDDAAADTLVWVFSRNRTLEEPRAGERVAAAAHALADGPARLADVAAADIRLYAEPVIVDGQRLGTVVAGISLAPYEDTRRTALFSSLAFGAAVLFVVALAARWLLAGSLRPVARMTRQAAMWSEQDLDQRFDLGAPRDELTELAATLDGLLDRLAASLRREQRFSAELSHELRTPLSRVITEAELALRRERTPGEYRGALAQVLRNSQQVARTVDALVAAARHEAGLARGTADAFVVAAEAADACAALAAERELALEIEPQSGPIRLGIDHELAERILQPVVENACRYGKTRVQVSIRRRSSVVEYTIHDDGAGVAEEERERIFEPGMRGSAAANGGERGSGLGLALARRLARSAAGEIDAEPGNGGTFLVRLPAA